jgi:ribosomal protein S18 acetylase RimI-like enzyme
LEFRPFRNQDVPLIAELWNSAGLGRGAAILHGTDELDYFVLAQPHFERQGLLVAVVDDKPVGFVHAGFGVSQDRAKLDRTTGVICALVVHPDHRRQGIGRQLVSRAEEYLQSQGAQILFAGPADPLNPYWNGIYGGSECAGFLESDPMAKPFLASLGYRPNRMIGIFQRPIGQRDPVSVRLMRVRRSTELRLLDDPVPKDFWTLTNRGRLETARLGLVLKKQNEPVGWLTICGLDLYASKWQQRAIGLHGIHIAPEHRRQGFGQALLCDVSKQLKDDRVDLLEAHANMEDPAAMAVLLSGGFQLVDTGIVYRKS